MRSRTIYPAKGWLRVLWSADDEAAAARICASTDIAEIPGCLSGRRHLDVPYTAFMLDAVQEALEALEVDEVSRKWRKGQPLELRDDIELARPLYPHQLDAVAFALKQGGVVIADEMGLGKSAEAAVAAEVARQHYRRPVLIVSTLAVQQVWRRELQALGFIDGLDDFCALESRNLEDTSFWRNAKYYFCHFEVVKAWWSKIYQVRPCATIIDEAHYIKNGKAQRSQGAAIAASSSQHRFLLTGTPMENRPSDLWHLLTVATGKGTWGHPLAFRTRYCGAEHDGFGWKDVGPTNVPELRKRLAPYYLRRTATEVGLDLPEFTRTSAYAELGIFEAEYRSVEKQLADFRMGSLESLIRAIAEGLVEQVLPELTRLRQITARAKIGASRDYINNAVEQGEAIVVFTWERATAETLFKNTACKRKYLVHGMHSGAVRDRAVQGFQSEQDPAVLVATYGALREGVTLHRARIVLLHDLDWTLSAMLQAEKRIHRLGQKRACQSVWMLARGSMDTLMAPILVRKAELMEQILGIKHDIVDTGLAALCGKDETERLIEQSLSLWDGALL